MSADVDNAFNVLLLVYGTYTSATGFSLNWAIPDSYSSNDSEAGNPTLALNKTIQNAVVPHGLLTSDQEAIYFTHASRSGITFIKRRDSTSSGDVHIESLAIICPTSVSSQPQTWHYISDLKNILVTCVDAESTRQAAESWYSTKIVKRARSVRILDSKTVTWEEQLADSAYHPLHNLPFFLRIFGPSFVTLYKYVLARMRVVIYVPPAVYTTNNMLRDNEAPISMDPDPSGSSETSLLRLTDASSFSARPCELASTLPHILSALCGGKDRPYALGFIDASGSTKTLFGQSVDSGFGWIACTADKRFIDSHTQDIDLVVDLSPVLNSPPLLETGNATNPHLLDGIRSPLLLVPSSSLSSAILEPGLEVRPTRFTLLDIQLWSSIQSVMKRIERAKQRALRSHERGRQGQGMNGTKLHRNGSRQGRSNISDSEDWDDGDFAVPGGWSANGNNSQHLEKSFTKPDEAGFSDQIKVQEETISGLGLQPPQLPQKSTYTLDLITAFHRHVVSLSKSYATMATLPTSSFSTTIFSPSIAGTPTPVTTSCLPSFEFDDLEKAFLEGGGHRRRGGLLNGTSSVVSEMKPDTSHLNNMFPTIARTNSSSATTTTTESTSTVSSPIVISSDKGSSAQPQPQPSPESSSPSNSHLLSPSSSPPRKSGYATPQSRSRSSSQDSARTTTLVDADVQPLPESLKISKPLSELHVTLGLSSSPGPYSPPPYPYVYPSTYPKRPDTVTSMASVPTSHFVTPDHSPALTARNSPVEVEEDNLEGTPIVTLPLKDIKLDDIEPLDMSQPIVNLPAATGGENAETEHEHNGFKQDVEEQGEKEKVLSNEADKAETGDGDGGGQSRNSISFPSNPPTTTITPSMPQSVPQNTPSTASKLKSKFFWHKRSLSDDVSSNLQVPSKPGTTTPRSGRESPATLKKRKRTSSSSVVLPTDLQILEVEAELREQEARMLAPSPTPPALVSPNLSPRRIKGWSVPADAFLGRREKEELGKDETGDNAENEDVPNVEEKIELKDSVDNAHGVDVDVNVNDADADDADGDNGNDKEAERNLVLTPVEVLWERRKESSVSPPPDTSLTSTSASPPPSNPLPATANSSSLTPEVSQPLLQSHLFSPQPLPPGAANPSPNVGPVITSIIDVLRGAIALHGDTTAVNAASSVLTEEPRASAYVENDMDPPLSPPPPLPAFTSSPARTPTPQSGRGTPRGLPKIDEEEEEGSIVSERSVDRGANSSVENVGRGLHEGQMVMKTNRRLRHVGPATDSGDAADAEGADGDGEMGSISSSATASGIVPPGLGLGPGLNLSTVAIDGGDAGDAGSMHGNSSMGMDNLTSSSLPPPSPGFLSTTAASVSSPSLLLPLLAPSPSPSPPPPPSLSPSKSLRVSPSPSPRPELLAAPASSPLSQTSFNDVGVGSSKAASKKSSSSSSKSVPTSSATSSRPLNSSFKRGDSMPVKGHGASLSMSRPSTPSSLISNLTKSLSLTIRPKRLSLLSSANSNLNGKKSGDGNGAENAGGERQGASVNSPSGSKKKNDDSTNLNSRSAPSTLSSTGSSNLVGSTNSSSPAPTSSKPTSPVRTSPSSISSGGSGWMKRSRIRASPASTLPGSSSSSNEPMFNMVTLMSAEEARSLGIEEWNGRNSGVGTLALANEMRRAQAESTKKSGLATTSVSASGLDTGDENGSPVTATDNGGAGVSPPESRPSSSLSSSKYAPPPKKGILRGRRVSLTASSSTPAEERGVVASPVRAASPTSVLSVKSNQKSKSTPILKNRIFNGQSGSASPSASPLTPTPNASLEQGSSGASAKQPPPPPPPPSSPFEPTSPLSPTRSITPDSTRRKLRKRRKSLIEPLGSNVNNVNLVESKPLSVPA